uniref:Sodium/glucose cotransporter 4 n=1 Tax=Macrostomum lignano TaxID=282301 RepID=A0A1I8I991_9PLAT
MTSIAHASGLEGLDIAIFVGYFVLVVITGVFSMCITKRGTVKGYFLAGRHMTWLPIGASLFASNIGSEHFIGLAGSGAASGISIGAFELNACILLQLLGWVFLPVYITSGIITLPEYMKRRFGGKRIQVYLAVLSLILYIFTKISVNLYSGAVFIKVALEWNVWLSILLLLGLTALVTMTGGLAAVIYTDTVQAVIMVLGSALLTIMGLAKIGGISGLIEKYPRAIANSSFHGNATDVNSTASRCGIPSEYSFTLLRPINDPDMPWLGFLLGQTPASIWYWCADQIGGISGLIEKYPRAIANSSFHGNATVNSTASRCGIPSEYSFTLLRPINDPDMPWLGFLLGQTPASIWYWCADQTSWRAPIRTRARKFAAVELAAQTWRFHSWLSPLLPMGLRGLLLAVMVSALITDLTSIFNSASTLFTIDIYAKFRPRASVREQLIVGKLTVVVVVLLSIAWIPIITTMQGSQLLIYIQDVVANLAPPIATVYTTAVLWHRANEIAAFSALSWGFVIGAIRLAVTSAFPDPPCGDPDLRPRWVVDLLPHYMYFAVASTLSTLAIVIGVSLLTAPPPSSQIRNLTIFSLDEEVVEPGDQSVNDFEMQNRAAATVERENLQVNGNKKGFCGRSCPLTPSSNEGRFSSINWRAMMHVWLQNFLGHTSDPEESQETSESKNPLRDERSPALPDRRRSRWEAIILKIFLALILLIATLINILLSVLPPKLTDL